MNDNTWFTVPMTALLGRLATLDRARDALTAAMRPHQIPDGTVQFTAVWWLVIA